MTAVHVISITAFIFIATGPGPALLFPVASAFVSGVSNEPSAGPFEGHLLLCFFVTVYIQGVAHMRPPPAHALALAIVILLLAVFLAVPQTVSYNRDLPSAVTGTCAFSIALMLSVNAFLLVASSYTWDSRCRELLLTTTAARAAEADAVRLLTNLMPPSIVDDIKSGHRSKPVLASNVVILVSKCRT